MEELVADLNAGLAEQYVTFTVGTLTFGVDIASVREIIRYQPLTEVPLSPKVVRGLINLRGHVLTAIDMRAVPRWRTSPQTPDPRISS